MSEESKFIEAAARLAPKMRYALPSLETKTPYGTKSQDPYTKLFESRIIFLGVPLDDVSASDVMAQLLVLEEIENDIPITININSSGGSFTAMTAIYDTMQYIRPPVQTICLGQASSAAAILLAAGAPGSRLALPNSRILIHQPSMEGSGYAQASDIEIQSKEMHRMRSWIETTLSHHTGRSVDSITEDVERDKFLSAHEAVEYGIIDAVLTSRKR